MNAASNTPLTRIETVMHTESNRESFGENKPDSLRKHAENQHEIKSGWGGYRPGAGRHPKLYAALPRTIGTRWYAVEAHPREEQLAVREILERGFNAYLPMVLVRRRPYRGGKQMDRVVDIQVPMFGGYLFVEFDRDNDNWAPIRYCDGVRRLFMTRTGMPIPIKIGEVEGFIDDAPNRLKLPSQSMPRITPGTLCKIGYDHPTLAGYLGECVACDGLNIVIEVVMFGRQCPLTLKREQVTTVGEITEEDRKAMR